MELADAHIAAIDYLFANEPKVLNLNIGTGIGTSVLKLVETFIKVNQCKVPFVFSNPRIGDVPYLVADNSLAIEILNWSPIRNIDEMCKDGWRWQKQNPNGFN